MIPSDESEAPGEEELAAALGPYDQEFDAPCPGGGTGHVTITAAYPLPQPPQDPITVLTGHGNLERTAPCTNSTDFDGKFVRTGD